MNAMAIEWQNHVENDPQVLRGKPCIRGTRILLALILGYLAGGRGMEQIMQEFPDLRAEDAAAAVANFGG
jgi:uncharacterized protein (DUF433 family)